MRRGIINRGVMSGAFFGLLFIFNVSNAQTAKLIYTTPTKRWVEQKKPLPLSRANELTPDVIVYPDSALLVIDGIGGAFNELGWTALKSSAGKNHLAFKLKDGRIILLVNNPKETEESVNVNIGKSVLLVQLQPTSINTIIIQDKN
ncbi:MAG TPA: hypothetical protein VMV77_20385 [Bacteroidales bacterium]|nr:hypothetical protein [Bacteroidales bacterium]